MEEVWKDIEGYEGLYQVSNLGNVKSLDRTQIQKRGDLYYNRKYKGQIIKPHLTHKGYCAIGVTKNNKHKNFSVHRLVAKAFIPNPENKPEVNHIDGNKQNNMVNNLEWCTRSENLKHAYNSKLKICTKKHRETAKYQCKKNFNKKILQYDLNGDFIKEWNSITEASNFYNISISCISQCCQGITKSAYKYIWRYKTPNFPLKISSCTKQYRCVSVLQYNFQYVFIKEYKSLTDASQKTNINISHISDCIRGKRKTAGGYMWKIKEEK